MFPYPSGRIHMGHVRNYAMGDVSRATSAPRASTCCIPMGWDAFGLPAENAAMEKKASIPHLDLRKHRGDEGQLKSLGLSLDWSREIRHLRPDYYRTSRRCSSTCWSAGLVYRKEARSTGIRST
jgi:leucyl-tRNA synthetase